MCVHGCPVAWRSARQAFVTLSTAENELTASIECAIALESIEALLHTVGFDVAEERVLHVDSPASLAISDGHGSWRTRHLRVRAEYLREQTRSGKLRLAFCPGVEQLADLLTKPLPSARIEELVRLWGMRDFAGDTADLEVRPSSSAAVDPVESLLCLLQIQPARSSSRESEYPGLQLDGSLELYFILSVALVCVLVVWEWLKRLCDRLDAWWAGSHASSRRAGRFRRMQRAVEDELAAQLQGMSLEDMSSRPPGGESAAHSETAPMPSQSSHELPAAPRPKASQSRRRPAVREQSTQTDCEPAFHPVTGVPPDPMPARIEIRTQYELPQGPFYFTAYGDCVHLDSNCWGLRRNTPLTTRHLCRVCRDRHRTGL